MKTGMVETPEGRRSACQLIEAELEAFATGALDPAQFHHREHLRLAFEMLDRLSFGETVVRFGAGLRLLAAKAGRPEIYHETKTVAFLAAIAERRARGGERSWEEFQAVNLDLADKSYLNRYYRREVLESDLARKVFLLPQPERRRVREGAQSW
ncbi:MAG: hypothetical protein ABI839_07915 [Verrucomicrobiota bacterium]